MYATDYKLVKIVSDIKQITLMIGLYFNLESLEI